MPAPTEEHLWHVRYNNPYHNAMVGHLHPEMIVYNSKRIDSNSYTLTFRKDKYVTIVVSLSLLDWDSGSDLVIENFVVDKSKTNQGYGTDILNTIINWAKCNEFKDIRAVQVNNKSVNFWIKNGFEKDQNSKTGDYVMKLN